MKVSCSPSIVLRLLPSPPCAVCFPDEELKLVAEWQPLVFQGEQRSSEMR